MTEIDFVNMWLIIIIKTNYHTKIRTFRKSLVLNYESNIIN